MDTKRELIGSLQSRQWARPDSNWRPSPCQGDVITTRLRAREGGHRRPAQNPFGVVTFYPYPPGNGLESGGWSFQW